MIHIPETLTMKTGDIAILLICAFCIGVAIACFKWISVNEKEENKE
jgi:hypothetical protein